MRIGIDAHYLGNSQSGNEAYVRGLMSGLSRVDGANEYAIYVSNPDVMANPPVVADNIEYRFVGSSKVGRIAAGIPLELMRHKVDLLQAHYNAPLFVPTKLVLVMHDISFATMPHLFPTVHGRQIALRAKTAVRKAERIVVASNATKHEVMDHYCVSEDRLAVIPLGVSERYEQRDKTAAHARVAQRYDTGDSFVLNVGDLQPRKNLPRLVTAFASLVHEGRAVKLVIVGKKAWAYDEVFEMIDRLGIRDSIVFTGYVPDDDIVDLYNAADLFVYPSIYEGFGLPPIEAMACGTPVIVSDEPTLRETVGDAAAFFDPYDTDSIASAIAMGLDNHTWREDARIAGIVRARSLSWDQCATRMLTIYSETGGA